MNTDPHKATPSHRRHLRRAIDWVLGFHGSPKQVARGLAIGVFIAFSPLVGFQMIAAALLATLTRANRAAAIAAVWITNPATMLPAYLTTYRVGRVFVPSTRPTDVKSRLLAVVVDEEGEWLNMAQQMRELVALGSDILIPLALGGLIVGGVTGLIAYFVARYTIELCQPRGGGRVPGIRDRTEGQGII